MKSGFLSQCQIYIIDISMWAQQCEFELNLIFILGLNFSFFLWLRFF